MSQSCFFVVLSHLCQNRLKRPGKTSELAGSSSRDVRGLHQLSSIELQASGSVRACVRALFGSIVITIRHAGPPRPCPLVIDGSIDIIASHTVPPPSFSLRLNKTVHDTSKHLSPPPLICLLVTLFECCLSVCLLLSSTVDSEGKGPYLGC